MPLTYAPRFLALDDVLKRMDDVDSAEEKFGVVRDALNALANHQKAEGKRIGFAIRSAGGEKASVRLVASDTLVASTDRTILFDSSVGNVDAALPLATEYPGLTVCFKQQTGGHTSTVTPRGADTINGAAGSITVTTAVWLQAQGDTGNWESI